MNGDPRTTILAALVGTAIVMTYRAVVNEGNVTPRTYGALVVVALMLMILGSFVPDLAAAFAVLVLLAVLLSGAQDLEGLASIGRRGNRG